MLLHDVVTTSTEVAGTRSRNGKIAAVAAALRRASPDEIGIVTSWLSGSLTQRRTGIGWRGARTDEPPARVASLTVVEVDATFDALSALSGAGSQGERSRLYGSLMSRATADEQRYLTALVTGETRQGALDGVMLEAISQASGVGSADVRRAAMFAGSSSEVARTALVDGAEAVRSVTLQVGRPIRPMLASSAKSVAEAMTKVAADGGAVAVEAKLDGIRIQVHRDAAGVRVYSRSLDDITERVPAVVDAVEALAADGVVLDGEALAVDDSGRPRLFQDTASAGYDLVPWFFDLLAVNGRNLVDEPFSVRARTLAEILPPQLLLRRIVTPDPDQAEAFAAEVLAAGHEGVVVKALDGPYEAGRRGSGWVKVKPVHTLDLVVLAVEWGSGRRRGLLSNIHLGARDGDGFVMLGKTFKGMTDQMLAWQTARFTELETRRDDWTVYLRPEQVVEIAFDGVQRSRRYPGGLALRFARVLRYRDDKTAAEADTIETVRSFANRG